MSKEYRVGVIGCGGISRAHANGYTAAEMPIAAAADISQEQLNQFAAQYNVEKLYTDYNQMLAKEKLDIVSICTWPPLHREMVVAAAEAGAKGILCEKPMAVNLAEADKMIEACDKSNTKLVIGHQRRFEAQYVKAKELIETGAIGDLISVHGCCGGDLLSDGTHNVDLLRFYANDSPIQWVIGQMDGHQKRTRYGHYIEDAAIGYFQFESGVRGFIEVGKVSLPGYQRAYIDGTDGRIEVNIPNQPALRVRRKGDADWFVPELQGENPFKLEILALVECIEQDKEHILSGRQARKALEILIAVFESSRRRALIELPLEVSDYPLETMIKTGEL
ncbi:Gfo/Idh/MocA family oxidoreductase [bacterium]|nr:Gfo/Idh/MocA family oxidoreductase [bacterium]